MRRAEQEPAKSQMTSPLSIKKNMLWNSVGSLINLGCQWLITIVIVRLSGGFEAAGIYSLAMSVYNTFSQLAQYRTYTYQISDVRGENTAGEYLYFRMITCGIALIVLTVYSFLTCRLDAIPAIVLYALYKMSSLLIDVLHAADQLGHRMDFIGKSLAMQGVASLVVFVGVFSVTGSLELTLLAMTLTTLTIGILYDLPCTLNLTSIELKISRDKIVHLLVYCAPVVVAGIACSAAPSLPRQMLSALMGDNALGAYASVAAPISIIQMGASYVYSPLLGYFSERYFDRDMKGFWSLLAKALLAISVVGVVCSIGIALLGAPVLSVVYGERILDYLYLVQPLVLCAVLTGVMWLLNDLLIALRGFRGTFLGSVVALVVVLLGMGPMISALGLNGVTLICILSTIASIAVMVICLLVLVRRDAREVSDD